MVAAAVQVPLKIKEDTDLFAFASWFEAAYTKVINGRNRKGSFKKLALGILSNAIAGGSSNSVVYEDSEEQYTLKSIIDNYKQSSVLPPELQAAKQNLNETDYAKLVELMEKAKGAK